MHWASPSPNNGSSHFSHSFWVSKLPFLEDSGNTGLGPTSMVPFNGIKALAGTSIIPKHWVLGVQHIYLVMIVTFLTALRKGFQPPPPLPPPPPFYIILWRLNQLCQWFYTFSSCIVFHEMLLSYVFIHVLQITVVFFFFSNTLLLNWGRLLSG